MSESPQPETPEQAAQPQPETPVSLETPVSRRAERNLVPFMQASTAWDQSTKRTALIVLLVVGAVMFWLSRPVLPILILAFMISYLLNPIVDLLERIRVPRGLSTVFLYLLLLLTIVISPILLIPILIEQLSALIVVDVSRTTQALVLAMQSWVNNLPTHIEVLGFELTIGNFVSQIQANFNGDIAFQVLPSARDLLEYFNRLISTATNVVGGTAYIGFTVVGSILNAFLFLLFLFFLSLYMTKDAPQIRNYIEGLFPQSYHGEAAELIRQMSKIWQAFFRGQLLLSLIIGVTTWGILRLVGMPGALILGILAGSMEVIPNIGPTIAMIPAVIVALIQGSTILEIGNLQFALLTVGIYFVVQQLENQLLVPRIIGTSVNLHPIVVLCGVVVGASVGGVLGAFLAAPIVASLRVVGSYVHAKLLDYPPFLNARIAAEDWRQSDVYRRVVMPSPAPDPESTDDTLLSASAQSNEFGSTAAQ